MKIFERWQSELIGTDDRWGELYVSNTTAGAPPSAATGFMPPCPPFPISKTPLSPPSTMRRFSVAPHSDAGPLCADNTDRNPVPRLCAVLLTPQRSHEYHSRCRRQHGLWKAYWVDDGGSQASATATYDYDAAGCLTNLNSTSLEWDERYRLKEVKIADGTNLTKSVSYKYDVLGHRVSRIEDSVTNFFVYDGQQIVADLDGNGDILRSYVWGPGIDNLLSMTVYTNGGAQASATYYAIKDHQNTVLAMADASGAVVESCEYDAYGNTTILDASGNESSESAIGNRYLFQGREYDSSTGLYYFRARWYDSDSGRWLSKDLIGIEGGFKPVRSI